jgi:hypothetical protein
MTKKDTGRKWMWWFLAVVAALQLYFVQELIAAFALFALGFVILAGVVSGLYLMQKAWENGLGRVADSSHPVVNAARRGLASVEDFAKRPLRRPRSEPAQ